MIAVIMSKPEDRNLFRTLYVASHNNAVDLLCEAELLFEKGRYARSYSLAFTALEEIAKSQLAADVYTGLIDEDEFQKVFWKHEKKIARMEWASIDAERYLSTDGYFVDVEKPSFTARNDAMYVGLQDGNVSVPKEMIGRLDAEGIIHTVNVAIHQILVTEEISGRIGTKGFMK